MRSLQKVTMKKTENLLSSKEAVREARSSLEKKTERAFEEFARSKQKNQEMAHLKYLD
jgi:hypothetical protein